MKMKYYLLIYLRKSGQCINKEDAFNNTYFDSSAEEFVIVMKDVQNIIQQEMKLFTIVLIA